MHTLQPTTDDDAVITEIPALRIEVSHREDMVILEQQDFGGEPPSRVAVHAAQVQLLAEHLGLLPPLDPDVKRHLKTIATLARRMRVLKERIDYLGRYLCVSSDSDHADLSHEQGYANATCDICDEFCADLDDLLATPSVLTGPSVERANPVGSARETQAKPSENPVGSGRQGSFL